MKHFNVGLIVTSSPQAKGRIERLWGTLQDRLVQEFRINGIQSIEAANEYLKAYIPKYNRKFSVVPTNQESAFHPKANLQELQFHLAEQHVRKLNNGLCFSFKNKTYQLPYEHKGKRITASRKDTVVIATSDIINIQVLHRGLILEPLLVTTPTPVKIVQQGIETAKPLKKKPKESPWRRSGPFTRTKENYVRYQEMHLNNQPSSG